MTAHDNVITVENSLIRTRLSRWFAGKLGSSVLKAEQSRIAQVLPDLFGYHILQIGGSGTEHLLDSSRINHKIITYLESDDISQNIASFYCASRSIPIATDSMDVVVLPHVLEFETNPHQVLRETERVLIGEGHVVILGFNPWSLWGLWRLFLAWREDPPWSGHYLGLTRLKDWLTLLDFEIIKTECFYFRPPIQNVKFMQRLKFMEQLGRYCWSYFGGVYLLVAKKRVIPLTPVKMQWRTRRHLIASGVAEPSARLTSIQDDH